MIGYLKKQIGKKTRLGKINKGFAENVGRLAKQMTKGRQNEDATRRWCIDILIGALGYKESELETEAQALGQRIDIAVMDHDRILMVIECKAASVDLRDKAAVQAANYASSVGAEWACTTNGKVWNLYRVTTRPGKEPDIMMVFHVDIFDDDGLSKDDAEMLYLLTKNALLGGDTLQEYHNQNALETEYLKMAFSDPAVAKLISEKLKYNYKQKTGVSVEVTPEMAIEQLSFYIDFIEENI